MCGVCTIYRWHLTSEVEGWTREGGGRGALPNQQSPVRQSSGLRSIRLKYTYTECARVHVTFNYVLCGVRSKITVTAVSQTHLLLSVG